MVSVPGSNAVQMGSSPNTQQDFESLDEPNSAQPHRAVLPALGNLLVQDDDARHRYPVFV